MSAFWDIILLERKTGYAHRAPAKRKAKDDGFGQCLITINGSLIGSDTSVSSNIEPSQNTLDGYLIPPVPPLIPLIPPENIVHIRTQSFDDAT